MQGHYEKENVMCKICGAKLKDDLFSFVTQEPVCSICKLNYIGGLPTSEERIKVVREKLGLKDGPVAASRARMAAVAS